ncbi:putative G-type lectin S-receptor-like serine/threonine-protein kinase At1g61610 [Triticum dicoccoides]|uniref:putative G-type lectin S-receptor-like serine/threonine-protein kinase At1g61610 n=1 Tax=Triticum dicoccoides TaxID=85692 RepID=UPI0018911549|nr:putative G-type lectin S-receptor-like serine/threonine-protein kinase At1g61610 [Triticum dicoccoides]
MASPWGSPSSSLWVTLGQASNVAQLVGVDALGLISMVVQAALAARRHRDACMQLAQHVELVGGLLKELELADLMRREATRRPLEQLRGALRRCYALVTACQDCSYLRRLLLGARMGNELRAAQHEIDMFIRLIPLIALVDNSTNTHRVQEAAEQVDGIFIEGSNHRVRFAARVLDITEIRVQGARKLCNVREHPSLGIVGTQEQKTLDNKELVKLCMLTVENYPGFTEFSYFQIMDATDNFSEKRYLGSGGFATAYKGQLPQGFVVGIKRFDHRATLSDFSNELQLARLQYTNIIRLLGWCIHGKERILIYKFMQNGSLDRHIFAKTLCSDITEEHTSRVVATSGYIAPEYASRGVYSLKTDVFSFGILVLETISGRKNTVLDKRGDTVGDLVRDAWHMWKDQRLRELVDPSLGNGYDIAEITRCAQVALLCSQEDPADRPTMTDIAAMLSSESMRLPVEPKRPYVLSEGGAGEDTYINQSSRTIDITITSSATVLTRVRIIVDPEV